MGTEGIYERYVNYFNRLAKSLEAAEIAKFNRKERIEYEESLKAFRDWYSVMKTARLEGKEEGREEGIKEGEKRGEERGEKRGTEKTQRAIAKKLKSMGASMEMITESTGLTPDEISRL